MKFFLMLLLCSKWRFLKLPDYETELYNSQTRNNRLGDVRLAEECIFSQIVNFTFGFNYGPALCRLGTGFWLRRELKQC